MKIKSILISAALLASSTSAMAFDWNGYRSFNPQPETSVEGLDAFENVVINYDKSEITVDTSAGMPFLTNATSGTQTVATSTAIWDMILEFEGQYAVQMRFPSLAEFGDYTLTIPAGTLKAASESCPELKFNYTVTDPNAGLDLPPLELISVTPASGTALSEVGTREGRTYEIDTNLNKEIGFVVAEWYDVTNPGNELFVAAATNTHLDDDGLIPSTPIEIFKISVGGEEMYIGHKYEMRVSCYNTNAYNRKLVGSLVIEYTGATEEYVYSDLELISVAPHPDYYVIEEPSQAKFTLRYSGPVTIDVGRSGIPVGPGISSGYESITANEDNTEFTIVIPQSVLNQATVINCYVLAHDAQGRAVRPSAELQRFANGEGDDAGVMLPYVSGVANKELDVTPGSGLVDELSTFRISCTLNGSACEIMQSWLAYPYIVKGRDVVYTFNLEDDLETDPNTGMWDPYYYIDLVLPTKITEAGNYALVIPAEAFYLTDAFGSMYNSKSMVIPYTIEGEVEERGIYDLVGTVTPAAGSDVESISYFKVSFDQDVASVTYDAFLLDEQGNQIAKADINFDDDWDNLRDYHITFTPAITDDGVYTLYIPEGAFGDENFAMDGNGHASKEIRANYSIKSVGVDTIAADRLSGDVYDITGKLVVRNASALQINNLDKGIYIINGNKVVVK